MQIFENDANGVMIPFFLQEPDGSDADIVLHRRLHKQGLEKHSEVLRFLSSDILHESEKVGISGREDSDSFFFIKMAIILMILEHHSIVCKKCLFLISLIIKKQD
jgi:hypothetical protein